MVTRANTRTVLVAAVLWAGLLAPSLAWAQPVAGKVLVIAASEKAGQIAPELKQIRALSKPPFNGFPSMKVLDTQKIKLEPKKAVTVQLPNGRHLKLELIERKPDGRYKVKVSINRPNQKDYLRLLEVVASPGEPFFVAGQKHQGDTLIIGVDVGKRPAKK